MLSILEQKMCVDERKVWARDLKKRKEACYPARVDQLDDRRDEVTNACHISDQGRPNPAASYQPRKS